ncbi:fas apoptotic inhibitory molecule 1 [Colletes gigas]|uniref:fas apoptotic inhibitory molecule 1 n=1 Tax=Colletes gigas TaxID=935657 RepID=UPI001C9B5C17|nr:fas apoptotic inhibitory molecule 1 [Colletes gigas]
MAAILLKSLHNLEAVDEPTVKWTIPLSDGNHVIEFEHGTATGRRVVKLDGKELIHRDWMFHLVGDEAFTFNDNKFVIRVDPIPGLRYCYTLWVNGKSYTNFVKGQSKILDTWLASVGKEEYRIVLDKQTQNIWVNGEQVDTENDFTDDGAEIRFTVGELPATIRSYSSGQKNVGISYSLHIDEIEIDKESQLKETEDS